MEKHMEMFERKRRFECILYFFKIIFSENNIIMAEETFSDYKIDSWLKHFQHQCH